MKDFGETNSEFRKGQIHLAMVTLQTMDRMLQEGNTTEENFLELESDLKRCAHAIQRAIDDEKIELAFDRDIERAKEKEMICNQIETLSVMIKTDTIEDIMKFIEGMTAKQV